MTKGKDFRVTEVFGPVFQGEGVYTGVPSIFVRLYGCNFTCSSFGMKAGEKSNERNLINPDDYNDVNELPLVTTGCDSYVAWDPRFKKFSKWHSVDELAERIHALLPGGSWNGVHLIMTGGEPLLGWQTKYMDLFQHPLIRSCLNVTFETNATQMLTPALHEGLSWRFGSPNVLFSMSPKLPTSGHSFEEAIKPDVVSSYRPFKRVFKFVIQDEDGVQQVKQALELYGDAGEFIPVYIMPVGGTIDELNQYRTPVANLALANNWRFTDRLQTTLYGNQWGV